MVSVAGFGIDLNEIKLLIQVLFVVVIILQFAANQDVPAFTVINDKIIGYPVCKATAGVGGVSTEFCFFPSANDIQATMKPIYVFMDTFSATSTSTALSNAENSTAAIPVVSFFGFTLNIDSIKATDLTSWASLLLLPLSFVNAIWIAIRLFVGLAGFAYILLFLYNVWYAMWLK
jgi:hypothetical protein